MQREYDAREEGMEKGSEKERVEIVLRMHAKQTLAPVIADLTGIAVDKV